MACALSLLFLVAGLFLGFRYHLGSTDAIGVVAAGIALSTLWLTWAGYRVSAREASKTAGPSLAEIAAGLAGRLRSQWEREVETRRLNDPYPLRVSWAVAGAPLAGDLAALRTLATSGAGWSAPAREDWAGEPEDLAAGGARNLADVLAKVPTGRLVVLGGPGAGKTMLMVSVVLELLRSARRGSGEPIPVLASLASWDPESQDLHGWLGTTIITGYLDLADAPPSGCTGNNRFEALLEAGLILPILDGLDEVPESARPLAITRINEQLKPGEQVVVTCRTEQYQAAVSPPDGRGAVLRAAAVQLNPLPLDEVVSYLRTDAGPAGEGRWDFLDTLAVESPVRRALVTPLMAGLARAIYNPRPDEATRDIPHPAELRDCTDRSAIEARLLDAFIPAAYRSPAGGRWASGQAGMWLAFLARHLEQGIRSPVLAWWQLSGPDITPARRMTIRVRRFARLFAAGFVGGFVAGFPAHLLNGLVGGLVAGLLVVYVAGIRGVPSDTAQVASPGEALARDRQATLLLMLVGGLVAGLGAFLAAWLAVGLKGGLMVAIVIGLAGAPVGALVVSRGQTAWPSYMVTRGWLAFRHRLPWSLMSFLADAHERGILRQAGAVYQFRHIELQHRLAAQEGPRPRLRGGHRRRQQDW